MPLELSSLTGRPWLRWGMQLVQAGLGLLAALLVFNFLVMPLFVQHGKEVSVPDLEGRRLEEAVAELAALGLSVRDTLARTNPAVPVGCIVEQVPRGGMTIKPERGVLLVVSSGRSRSSVPALAGQGQRFARIILGQEGYVLGAVLRHGSSRREKNDVIASDPPSGTVVPPGEQVSLLVSDGPAPALWIMPDLRGEGLRTTADRLRFAGFPVRLQEEDEGFRQGRIRSTRPFPGSQVAAGDTIWLIGD